MTAVLRRDKINGCAYFMQMYTVLRVFMTLNSIINTACNSGTDLTLYVFKHLLFVLIQLFPYFTVNKTMMFQCCDIDIFDATFQQWGSWVPKTSNNSVLFFCCQVDMKKSLQMHV